MIEILQVPAPAVEGFWPQVEDYLAPSIDLTHGCMEPEDVLALCVTGNAQLWVAVDGEDVLAAYVTEIHQYPRKRVVRALFAGGKTGSMDKWLDQMVEAIEEWSRGWGCQAIEAVGRKGWARIVDGEQVGVHLWRDYPMEMH